MANASRRFMQQHPWLREPVHLKELTSTTMVRMIDTFNDQQVITPRVGREAKKQLLRLLEAIHRLEATGISVKNSDISWNGLAALDGKRARQQVWEQAQDERTKPNFDGCRRCHSKPR